MKSAIQLSAPILLVLVLATAGWAPAAFAVGKVWTTETMLQDPEWRASFLGSYGFLSGAEPDINAEELEMLRDVLDLMKVNPRAAAQMLTKNRSESSSAALDFILANLYFQNDQKEEAEKYYLSAIQKFPDFRRAHKNLGLVHVQTGKHELAIRHMSRAVELGDRDGRNYGLMGYCYLNLGKHLPAEIAYRNAILQQPESKDWKLGLARSLNALGKYAEAIGLFDALIAEDPADPNYWLAQANSYLGMEQPMKAAVNLEAVRMLGEPRTSSLVLLGDIYMNAQMPELAANAYLEVIRRDADRTEFKNAYRAAELLIRTRSYEKGNEILATIEKQYGKKMTQDQELEVLTLKAKVARAKGQDETAAKLLESIVKRDGTRGEALLELADYYQSKGDHERAVLLAERAERLEQFERQALLKHAQFLVAEKKYGEAASRLRKALEIQSEPRVERFLARVEAAASRG